MHFFNNKSDQKERVKTHNHKGQLCGLNRESPCFVLAFCGSALAPPAPCSEGGTAWIDSFIFPPSSCSLEDHSLSPVNSIFIILEKPGKKKKKHALRCFHISRRRSVVFVAKNMLKYHRFFLLLLSLFHLQQSAFRWKQTLHGMISLCFKSPCALPGSQAQCRTCDRATIPGRVDKPSRCGFLGKG